MGKSFKRSRDDYEDDDYIDLHVKKKNDIREKQEDLLVAGKQKNIKLEKSFIMIIVKCL